MRAFVCSLAVFVALVCLAESRNLASLRRLSMETAVGIDVTEAQLKTQLKYFGAVFKSWPTAPIMLGGSAALYCMDPTKFATVMGKPRPGDLDFIVINPTSDKNEVFRLAQATKAAQVLTEVLNTNDKDKPNPSAGCEATVKNLPGKLSSGVFVGPKSGEKCSDLYTWKDGFLMHITHSKFKKVQFCRCPGAPCANVHLAPLPYIQPDYLLSSVDSKRPFAKKTADKKKLTLIEALLGSNQTNVCGPCQLFDETGQPVSSAPAPAPAPSSAQPAAAESEKGGSSEQGDAKKE